MLLVSIVNNNEIEGNMTPKRGRTAEVRAERAEKKELPTALVVESSKP